MRITERKKVFETPWFRVISKMTTGLEDAYYSLELADYVAILALTPDGRIVLVKQFRPTVEQTTLEIPSGTVDPGESPAQTAARELREETGYQAASLELIVPPMAPDTGRLANRMWCYLARDVEPVENKDEVLEEGIEPVLYTMEELKQAIACGAFNHALHVAVLGAALIKGLISIESPGDAFPGAYFANEEHR